MTDPPGQPSVARRTLDELEERLCWARAAVAERERLEQRLEHARRHAAALQARSARLAERAAREQRDVEALAGLSFAALVVQLFGDLEGRRQEELQESLGAQLRLEQVRAELQATEADCAALQRRIETDPDPQLEYARLLAEKDRWLSLHPVEESALRGHLVEREGLLRDALREFDEAEWAGQVARATLSGLLHALSAAQALGRLDVFGMASSWGKLGHLDDAQRHASAAQRALSRFQRELADVHARHEAQLALQVSQFATFADAFLDDLVSDWVVLCRIERSHTNAGIAATRVQKALRQLLQRRAVLAHELAALRARRLGLPGASAGGYPAG